MHQPLILDEMALIIFAHREEQNSSLSITTGNTGFGNAALFIDKNNEVRINSSTVDYGDFKLQVTGNATFSGKVTHDPRSSK